MRSSPSCEYDLTAYVSKSLARTSMSGRFSHDGSLFAIAFRVTFSRPAGLCTVQHLHHGSRRFPGVDLDFKTRHQAAVILVDHAVTRLAHETLKRGAQLLERNLLPCGGEKSVEIKTLAVGVTARQCGIPRLSKDQAFLAALQGLPAGRAGYRCRELRLLEKLVGRIGAANQVDVAESAQPSKEQLAALKERLLRIFLHQNHPILFHQSAQQLDCIELVLVHPAESGGRQLRLQMQGKVNEFLSGGDQLIDGMAIKGVLAQSADVRPLQIRGAVLDQHALDSLLHGTHRVPEKRRQPR